MVGSSGAMVASLEKGSCVGFYLCVVRLLGGCDHECWGFNTARMLVIKT